ncbi:hypothetical protein [Raineyella fluvialis]|uniref:DNA-directed RNA polymerase subunit beta n=1 Tax=Raineyella fluvialis TaxID=2662261 RepID=A0A5Q2FJP1_9ACTN|nr:hypothetical protein [Raineyella fluvialis]QGF24875.1 hypothetical protein Rai3103_16010 [Raineyella fluvialis]
MTEDRRPRRPGFLPPAALEALGERTDPIAALHAAHESAAILLHAGRATDDPAVTDRLVALVDDIGLDTLADLWAQRPARTLPGALWRLYVLHSWVLTDPYGAAREYAAGIRFTEPDHAVAGAGDPTGPDEVRRVTDEILRGVFDGDFAIALERAAAFCHVVSSGRAEVSEGTQAALQAARMQTMAEDLTACAQLWRTDALH